MATKRRITRKRKGSRKKKSRSKKLNKKRKSRRKNKMITRSKCKKLRKTKDPKCNDQDGCKWIVGKGCSDNESRGSIPSPPKKSSCSKLRKSKDPKCNDQIGCEWKVGKGCKRKLEESDNELVHRTMIILPQMYDNENVYAGTTEALKLAYQNKDRIFEWYKNQYQMNIFFINHTISMNKHGLIIVKYSLDKGTDGDLFPEMIADPDDDGNYPIDGYLISPYKYNVDKRLVMTKTLKRMYSIGGRQSTRSSGSLDIPTNEQELLETNMKRLRVEIYAGFVMQLVGDQMVSDHGGPSRLIELMNTKYKRKVRAACSDGRTYDELRADLGKTKFKDTVVSHLFRGETCSHFVYYDENGNRYDSYTTGRQCDDTNQFCQNHALFMAYQPEFRQDITMGGINIETPEEFHSAFGHYRPQTRGYIVALLQLAQFWRENLVDIMKITSQEDFNNNIHNLRMTNMNEKDEKLFLYGDNLIVGIKSMIENKQFEMLKEEIISSLFEDEETIVMMADW